MKFLNLALIAEKTKHDPLNMEVRNPNEENRKLYLPKGVKKNECG